MIFSSLLMGIAIVFIIFYAMDPVSYTHLSDVVEKMIENGAELAVYGKGESAYSIPEHLSLIHI